MSSTRRTLLLTALSGAASRLGHAQEKVEFVCPMDPEIHQLVAGRCPRCGMALEARLPPFEEYPVDLVIDPAIPRPGEPLHLRFRIRHPRTQQPFSTFTEMHEKLFHLFLVSEDLGYFAHEHPELQRDGSFTLTTRLPHPGLFRLLCDFYPSGGRPQMIARTILVPGSPPVAAPLQITRGDQAGTNLQISLRMEPAAPLAGKETLLFFEVRPAEVIQPYLGAWGHLLAASADLIDMIHTHPTVADGGKEVQFNLIFPRPGLHRLWLQMQRAGVVNTVPFTVPVVSI